MNLPAGTLNRSKFDFKGTSIAIRSLSRAEVLAMRPMGEDYDAVEIHLLMCGTDSSKEEVDAFRGSEGDSGKINDLIQAISDLSGLATTAENGSGPKA